MVKIKVDKKQKLVGFEVQRSGGRERRRYLGTALDIQRVRQEQISPYTLVGSGPFPITLDTQREREWEERKSTVSTYFVQRIVHSVRNRKAKIEWTDQNLLSFVFGLVLGLVRSIRYKNLGLFFQLNKISYFYIRLNPLYYLSKKICPSLQTISVISCMQLRNE